MGKDREAAGTIVIEGTASNAADTLVHLGLIPDLSGELRKTDAETRAIGAAFAALSDLCLCLGLDAPALDPGAIHVFDDREFWSRWGSERRAFTQFGHVYLARRFLFLYFLQDLTHEIVHACALRAVIEPARDADGSIAYVRSGFSPLDGRPSTRWRFVGFNEGVTELIAMAVRARMADAAREFLSEEMTRVFLGECLYPTFVMLVDGLLEKAGGDAEAEQRKLFVDYLTRSSGSLRSIARRMPGALRTLAAVESGGDALVAAERLGLAATAARIRRRLVRRRRR